ncbi:MAG: hypothetical protein WCG00_12595 [Hyphomicrobiales bacterium]
MQLHCTPATLSSLRAFAAPLQCPTCGEVMIAPFMSEFVEGGEIRHHWVCDGCGGTATTSIGLALEETAQV